MQINNGCVVHQLQYNGSRISQVPCKISACLSYCLFSDQMFCTAPGTVSSIAVVDACFACRCMSAPQLPAVRNFRHSRLAAATSWFQRQAKQFVFESLHHGFRELGNKNWRGCSWQYEKNMLVTNRPKMHGKLA